MSLKFIYVLYCYPNTRIRIRFIAFILLTCNLLKANYAFKKASRALDPYIHSHIYTQTHKYSMFTFVFNYCKEYVLLRRMCIILIRKTFYKYQLPKWNGAITDTFYIAQGNYVHWIILQITIKFYSILRQWCRLKL